MTDTNNDTQSIIGSLLFGSRRSVFRLESLPQYLMEEEEDAFRSWKQGEPFAWPPEVLAFVDATRNDVARGIAHTRVRVVPAPISDYFRFELSFYPHLVAAGVDIRFIASNQLPVALAEVFDFYLFDDERAVRLLYTMEGAWLGETELIDELHRKAIALANDVIARSMSFDEFTSTS